MKNNKDQYKKIFAKISTRMPKAVFGLTPVGFGSSSKVSFELAKTMAKVKKTLLIDLDNESSMDTSFANINELLRNKASFLKDGDLYRLNFTKSDDVDMIVQSKDFLKLMEMAKNDFDYILVNEKPIDKSQAYFTKPIEDGKILLIKEDKTDRRDFKLALEDMKNLGFKIFGVIYHK